MNISSLTLFASFILLALAFSVGSAWNSAIKAILVRFYSPSGTVTSLVIYAIVITFVMLGISTYIASKIKDINIGGIIPIGQTQMSSNNL